MPDGIRIVVPAQWKAWEQGAQQMARGFAGRRVDFELANEHFFSETQRFVHVVTGDLKRSGREHVEVVQGEIIATVEYGNDHVDYAQFELDRGGEHDFYALAWEASQGMFEAVFGDAWNKVVNSWR